MKQKIYVSGANGMVGKNIIETLMGGGGKISMKYLNPHQKN